MEGFDIEFADILLTVNTWDPLVTMKWMPEKTTILRSVSGTFFKNQMSAIIGCSGSGKSSLLNILSGFNSSSYKGSVTLNGMQRDLSSFRKISSYIMQEDHLQLYLTVLESMEISMKLKHSIINLDTDKQDTISELLNSLLLNEQRNTLVYKLSGGERKRLTIALELIRSPKVMFFDEPTTGLDIVSANNVLKILRKLADSGKTIVCSIHQATANHLDIFDTVYVLSPNGQCIYNGEPRQMVNYFFTLGLQCPKYHNPADYVLELSMGEYGNHNDILSKNVIEKNHDERQKYGNINNNMYVIHKREYPTNIFPEIWILMRRSMLITFRDNFLVNVRLFVHILLGSMFGVVYYGLGDNGMHVRDNAVLLFFCVMFSVYTAAFTMSVKFPLEFSIMQKEYFNRWYSLKSYYISVTLVDLPLQICCTLVFCALIYLLSGQPLVLFRVTLFLLMFIMTGLMSQAIGMLVSTFFQNFVTNSIVVAVILLFWTTYAGGMIRISDTPEIYRWLYDFSFMKHAVQGVLHSVYGFDRPVLPCPTVFCLYGSPKLILQVLDMGDNIYWTNFSFITSIYIVLKIFIYVSLKYKLSSR
ncbi:ATP-binding cassette sub-family G member 1-like [Adelges cooleyi]|uniref:ATP-binding cassette sub-family G member 1-like n=1 Tax=Adelges cooleyi TaxID=133065 RepID=UPI0021808FB1|nr:ATP-binding cassette sub-family G member 1-like [Adelges cooleyi]XP_050431661.1 ATP-binding cassette sub-family G member 1-like [Adelges cooleyi]